MVALPARHGVAQTAAVNEAIVRTKTMKVICEDGLTIDCTEFKAIDTGIVLIGGEDESGAVGYVPNERLVYVLPDDVVALEHDRLGVPAPEISSADELESRLGTFLDEIEILRESLDRQVEDLIGEGVDRDYVVAVIEQVLRDVVRGLPWRGRAADDGDRLTVQDLTERLVVCDRHTHTGEGGWKSLPLVRTERFKPQREQRLTAGA